jgi:uncharacterized protein
MVNHACNLRCAYCYTGAKFSAPMPIGTGVAAIDRALRSLVPGGGLDLSFFGGEPLLEPARIIHWMARGRSRATEWGKSVRFNLTTNGTISRPEAWRVMMEEDLDLAVSFDGTPHAHDMHRRDAAGRGTSAAVLATIRQLVDAGKLFHVVLVVRPDTVDEIPDGLQFLHSVGVRHVDLSLDLWTVWTQRDARRMEEAVARAATLWRGWLPEFSLNWFDTKLSSLAQIPATKSSSRCGFGAGEIAVAPSGRLYPCERLIGEDSPSHPLRISGLAQEGDDFLGGQAGPFQRSGTCDGCVLADACDTSCRCGNYIRTGDPTRPDGLLCALNKATTRAIAEFVAGETSSNQSAF